MKLRFLIIALLTFALGFAQEKATITGKVSDGEMGGEPLPFASILIKGTSISANSDETGTYTISVDPGTYTLVFTFLGYESKEAEVSVAAGETKVVDQTIGATSVQLQDVVLTGVRKKNTETAVLMEMREAKQVVSAISAQQIAKSTDGNAAEAIQRVPGVTIVEGKFAMIRGLSERYNNVLLNNSIAPSTAVDKRTFSFDLIPTSALDKMMIYKTGSADKPGDFAGGIITVTTSENTSEFTKAEISLGYRPGTTFDNQYQPEGSKTDWLGFDNSFRPLPSGFNTPSTGIIPGQQANTLPNTFNPTKSTAFFDSGVGFSLGRKISIGSGDNTLFTVNGLSYGTGYQYIDREFKRYTSLNAGETRPPLRDNYSDDVYQQSTKLTVLSNWMLSLGANHKLKFKNLINQQGTEETTIREGYNYLQRGQDYLRNYYMIYQDRFIYTGQLEGEHEFASNKKLDWVVGYNSIADNMPDFRRVRTFRPAGQPEDASFVIIDPPSSNPFDAGRFYGKLNEYSINHGANYTYNIERTKDNEDIGDIVLKTGYYASYRKRDFSAQYFTYLIPGYVSDEARRQELKNLPLSEAFSSTYVNDVDGWSLRSGTRPEDSYSGDNTYLAGYAQGELPLGKFDITAGVRVEHNIQTLTSAKTSGEDVDVNNPITSFLPSVNIGYNVNDNSILRLAYSRTVNRPEFRELAPFLFYDYMYDVVIEGNEGLKTATIDNMDFRFEYYPSKNEILSLGGFFKQFKNPIEFNTLIAGESPQFRYNNADSASNYGLEVEIKKSFGDVFGSAFFDRISANINASYIISEVDLGSGAVAQERKRALQGQSPYVVNAALGYEDEKGLTANIIYNRFGDRIFSVGDNNFPSWYELSRDNIDLTVSKKINKTTIKLGVQDLLNAKYRIFEDSNRDSKITKAKDNVVSSFRRGTHFSINVAYNF